MSANFSDKRALQICAALVVALAAPVLWSWFGPPESVTEVVALTGSRALRGIASVTEAGAEASKNGKFSRPITVEWDPSKAGFQREIDGTHLRLKGLLRGAKPDAITNRTNGFTAAVFASGDSYSTDFIELKEGPNEITVQTQDSKGRKITKTLQVTRAPASE